MSFEVLTEVISKAAFFLETLSRGPIHETLAILVQLVLLTLFSRALYLA